MGGKREEGGRKEERKSATNQTNARTREREIAKRTLTSPPTKSDPASSNREPLHPLNRSLSIRLLDELNEATSLSRRDLDLSKTNDETKQNEESAKHASVSSRLEASLLFSFFVFLEGGGRGGGGVGRTHVSDLPKRSKESL